MKIEQVAIYTKNPSKAKEALSAIGFNEWHTDHVHAKGEVFGQKGENKAELNFNYQMGDFEFELLNYVEGNNWIEARGQTSGMSHLGLHVDDVEPHKDKMKALGYKIAQEVETISHTNPVIDGKRKYKYVIFDTRAAFGFDLKLIQRIDL